jgi:hypothetical protein
MLLDTEQQKKRFEENPAEYVAYCKEIEDELNQRFKLILKDTPEAVAARVVRCVYFGNSRSKADNIY